MNLARYKELICKTANAYTFKKINQDLSFENIETCGKRICFLRHDIDFSPTSALKMAEIEAEHGVISTFTILLSGQWYSPFEKKTKDLLREIKNYDHEIGLHFDPTAYEISIESQLDAFVSKEASILEDLMQTRIEMFSFHNTTDFSMSCRSESYGGLVNAYSNFFHNDVEYTSDSLGYWRFRTWEELLLEGHNIIQVLTHPIWWKEGGTLPPFETVVQNCLERYRNQVSDWTKVFDRQDVGLNKSAISKMLNNILEKNDASMMNSYSEFPSLIESLLINLSNCREIDLDNIVREFLKK